MTNYKFGDVVLVPFPFTDKSISKKRPSIIVSSYDYQRQRSDLIMIAVSSLCIRQAVIFLKTSSSTSFNNVDLSEVEF